VLGTVFGGAPAAHPAIAQIPAHKKRTEAKRPTGRFAPVLKIFKPAEKINAV
jgi:hypothetical protein